MIAGESYRLKQKRKSGFFGEPIRRRHRQRLHAQYAVRRSRFALSALTSRMPSLPALPRRYCV
jgi:hypothetical protein